MSRCFPFPPPGYEKKPRTDDADLLKKEKHKEKKHKKDKKDKDKKESKEKREKDRSDGKNKDKKDRKEKHREKKKDKEKDRDKDKDKNTTSEEKRVGGLVDGYNGEKIHPREELDKETKCSSDAIQYIGQQGGKPIQSSSILVRETEDPKFVQELGRRIRDDDKEGAGTSQLFEKFGMVSEGKNKEKKADNNNMVGQRVRDEASFVGITMVENRARMPQNKLEGPTILSDKKVERKIEEKTKSRDREIDDKRGDKRKKKEIDKKSQGKERDGEKEKKKEEKGKEKSEHKKTEKQKTKDSSKNDIVCASNDKFIHLSKDGAETAASEGNLKKRKAVETNGFSHDDELPRPNKMPRPSSTQNGRMLEPSYQSPGLFPLDRQRQVAMASPNNLKIDNKEQKINGIIASPSPPLPLFKPRPSSSTASHNMKTFPVSLSKPSSSSTANEPSVSTVKPPFATANEIAAPVMSEKPPFASSNETVASVASICATKQASGIILASDSAAAAAANKASRKQSSSAANKNQVAMKPPHPDSKFLSQILSVPKMEEEVCDVDDQEWLLSSKDGLLKKPDSKASVEEPQVWAEAVRLESVDIFALPYVVPY